MTTEEAEKGLVFAVLIKFRFKILFVAETERKLIATARLGPQLWGGRRSAPMGCYGFIPRCINGQGLSNRSAINRRRHG